MTKMRIFNKTAINDVFIVDAFKNVFQRRSSEGPEGLVSRVEHAALSMERRSLVLSITDKSVSRETDQFSFS